MKSHTIIFLGVLVLGLLVGYVGHTLSSDSSEQLLRSKESLMSMHQSATAMVHLQRQRSKIPRELKRFDQANIIGFIESKLSEAGVSKSSIIRMTPSERVRDRETNEVELQITLSLKSVKSEKVFSFLYEVESAAVGLKSSSLRFDDSSKGDGLWDVQAIISCFIKRSR